MLLIVIFYCILFHASINAMNEHVLIGDVGKGMEQKIKWKGCEPLALPGHVLKSKENEKHPFSVNSIFKLVESKNSIKFIKLGTFRSYRFLPEEWKEIKAGNWIFTDYYTTAKTHLSPGWYQEIGALILGTRDPEMVETLLDANFEIEKKELLDAQKEYYKQKQQDQEEG